MGVTVTEKYTLDSGLDVDSYYASLAHSEIRMQKPELMYEQPGRYTLDAGFTFWISKEARDSGKRAIGSEGISITQGTPIAENVYGVLYGKFKEKHPNSVDA